jgi:hypothetical protein
VNTRRQSVNIAGRVLTAAGIGFDGYIVVGQKIKRTERA